jgi:hypothetical protein
MQGRARSVGGPSQRRQGSGPETWSDGRFFSGVVGGTTPCEGGVVGHVKMGILGRTSTLLGFVHPARPCARHNTVVVLVHPADLILELLIAHPFLLGRVQITLVGDPHKGDVRIFVRDPQLSIARGPDWGDPAKTACAMSQSEE